MLTGHTMNSPKPRLLMITQAVPRTHTGNAGQNYLSARAQHWQDQFEVKCLLLPGRSAREDLSSALCETHVLQSSPHSTLLQRISNRVRRTFPGLADPAVAMDLKHDSRALAWLFEADVVVLEWQEMAGHAQTIRRLSPSAEIVSVFHDVVSQSVERRISQAKGLREKLKLRAVRSVARLSEHWAVAMSDVAVVLSPKDAALLPSGKARIAVVPPAIVAPAQPARDAELSTIMMVAGWRQEDVNGLDWFLSRVLPLVNKAGLSPAVHLVGRMPEGLRSHWAGQPVIIDGFVPDLASCYSRATAAIIPLQLGAGVKFKTVEAILHRVPIVTTPVGAEGIQGLEQTSVVSNGAGEFADRLVKILHDPGAAQAEADALAAEVAHHQGMDAFRAAMNELL